MIALHPHGHGAGRREHPERAEQHGVAQPPAFGQPEEQTVVHVRERAEQQHGHEPKQVILGRRDHVLVRCQKAQHASLRQEQSGEECHRETDAGAQ